MALDNGIVIVSGLPRSGTSLMMRMLDAGGMPVVKDDIRASNTDNPHGYYEFEPVKQMGEDSAWLDKARGKAIKVISKLLSELPSGFEYYVLFMQRAYDEVIASQKKMLARRGKKGADVSDEKLAQVYAHHVDATRSMCSGKENMHLLDVEYSSLVLQPDTQILHIASFLSAFATLDQERMKAIIDPSLYRNRHD